MKYYMPGNSVLLPNKSNPKKAVSDKALKKSDKVLVKIVPPVYSPSEYRHVFIDKTFSNCREILEYLRIDGNIGEADVRFTPKLDKKEVSKRQDGKFVAKVFVEWVIDKKNSSIELLRVHLKDGWTKDLVNAVQNGLYNPLLVHEIGHFTIAINVAKENSKSVEAEADSEGEALKALQTELENHRKDVLKNLDTKREEYDTRTDHGRMQNKYDSTHQNIYLSCPNSE